MDGKVRGSAPPPAGTEYAAPSQQAARAETAAPLPSEIDAVKPPPIVGERLAEMLLSFGLKASAENIAMLRLLYDNGHPLTKDNLLKLNHALKLAGEPDKAMFLFENQLKISASNLALLDGIVSGKAKITNMLDNLAQAVKGMRKTPDLMQKLEEILYRPKEPLAELMQGLTRRPQDVPRPLQPGQPAQSAQQPVQPGQPFQPVQPVKIERLTTMSALHKINIAHLGQFKPAGETAAAPPEQLPGLPAARPVFLKHLPTPAEPTRTIQTTDQPARTDQPAQAPPDSLAGGETAGAKAEAPPAGEPGLAAIMPEIPANESPARAVPDAAGGETQPAQAGPRTFDGLLLKPSEGNPQEITRYVAALRSRLVEIIQETRDAPGPAAARVAAAAREIINHIDFAAQIRTQIYVQLPYSMGQQDVALHVFKDARKSKASDARGVTSAYISLDTLNLGHFEAYVQKKDKSVHCQFRLGSEEGARLVGENIERLGSLLEDFGLTLASHSCKQSDEVFTVLQKPEKPFAAPFAEPALIDETA